MNLAKQMKHYCQLSFNKSLTVCSHVLLVIKNKGMAFKAYLPVLLFQLSVPCSILVFDAVLEPLNFRDKTTWPVAELFFRTQRSHVIAPQHK